MFGTWALIFIAVICFLLFRLAIMEVPTLRTLRMMWNIPGPPCQFILGNSLLLNQIPPNDILTWLTDITLKYPRMMRFWIMGSANTFIWKPEDLQALWSSTLHIKKNYEYLSLDPWLQEGLLTSTGEKWHQRRKMLTAPFHFRILEDSITVFNHHCATLCEKLAATAELPVEVEPIFSLATLDIISDAAMGVQLGAQNNKTGEYVKNIKRLSEIAAFRILQWYYYNFQWIYLYLTKEGRDYRYCIKYLHEFTTKIINERKATFSLDSMSNDLSSNGKSKKKRLAFLDTLLEIEARNPGTLTVDDMREEVDTFMFEGHDTTSVALVFFFFNMGLNPDMQERVYEEIMSEVGSERDIDAKMVGKLEYLDQCLKESLRYYPSVPYTSRRLEHDLNLSGGIVIPKDSGVIVMPYRVHHDEESWPDSWEYDPERFTEENSHGRHPFAYIPFSAGPRNCIGQKFALLELKVTICWVLRQFKVVSHTKREDLKVSPYLVLRSSVPVRLSFHPR